MIMHGIKGFVNIVQREDVGNAFINLKSTSHVLLNNTGQLTAALNSALWTKES